MSLTFQYTCDAIMHKCNSCFPLNTS